MSMIVREATVPEINASIVELRRYADRALKDNQAITELISKGEPGLTGAYEGLASYYYNYIYYTSLTNRLRALIGGEDDGSYTADQGQ